MNQDLLALRVDEIELELPDVATFYLVEAFGKRVPYMAGQFITLVFDHHGEEVRRSYSLSSSPDEGRLSITVKRISNGEISRFLLAKINRGDLLYAIAPAGVFVVKDSEAEKDLVFFAAGSGITPVYSLLKNILNRPGKSRLHLVYSSLSGQSIIFKDKLDKLKKAHPGRLHVTYLISSDANRLTNLIVERIVETQLNFPREAASFYICGPFDYMRMITLTLGYMGISKEQVHKENFVLETVPVTGSVVNYPPKSIQIDFRGELHDIVVGENQSILQAALQNNISLPYSCRSGICSACVAYCKTGQVEMTSNEVLTPDDLARGWILTCTGHPLTDGLLIEYPQK